jgi:uncharacterized membrane protein YtjA (UPF0391 family)
MLKFAIIFALIALVAGALGYTGLASGASRIAKFFFVLFLVVAAIFVAMALLGVHLLL